MNLTEIILCLILLLVIIIDYLIKKKKKKIQFNLIGDETIEFKKQKNFYHLKNYIKQYFSKVILAFFGITLIVTNPSNAEDFSKWVHIKTRFTKESKIASDSDYTLRNNFFFFCILQQTHYDHTYHYDIKKKRKYIGILKCYFLISQEEETIQKNRPPNNTTLRPMIPIY